MALVSERAYEELISELGKLQASLGNDASYLLQSAKLCAQAMENDETSTKLVSRVSTCCSMIADLCDQAAAFQRDLQDELDAIREI